MKDRKPHARGSLPGQARCSVRGQQLSQWRAPGRACRACRSGLGIAAAVLVAWVRAFLPSIAAAPQSGFLATLLSATVAPEAFAAAEPLKGASAPLRPGPKPVTLEPAEQNRLGVAVTTLQPARAPTGIATTARVLDPGPLLQLDSDLAAATASLTASRAESERTRRLYAEDRTASARALESANAQEQSDLQRVYSAQRRLALEWGDGIAGMPQTRRARLLNDLVHVRSELIRVEMPGGTPTPKRGASIEVRSAADAPVLKAEVLGTLPTADPHLQTRGVLAELKGGEATLPIGQMVAAEIPFGTPSPSGVVLPRAALLRKDSQVWAYVQTAPTTFLRREVTEYRPVLAGWFVEKGFVPGDRVVTAGAAALLGVESPAPEDTN